MMEEARKGAAKVSRGLTVEEKDLVDRSKKNIEGEIHGFSGDSSSSHMLKF